MSLVFLTDLLCHYQLNMSRATKYNITRVQPEGVISKQDRVKFARDEIVIDCLAIEQVQSWIRMVRIRIIDN